MALNFIKTPILNKINFYHSNCNNNIQLREQPIVQTKFLSNEISKNSKSCSNLSDDEAG